MADRSVRVLLGANTQDFSRGMGAAGRDTDGLIRRLELLDRAVSRVDGRRVDVQVGMDRTAFDAELARLRLASARIDVRSGLDTSGWERQAREAAARLRVTVRSDLRVEVHGRLSERELQDQLDRMTLHVRVQPRSGSLNPLAGGPGGGGGGGSSMPRLLAVGVAGLVTALPQVISQLNLATAGAAALGSQLALAGSAGAGLVPIAGAVAQAFGTVKLGTMGVAAAFKAYTQQQDGAGQAATVSASRVRNAARTVRNAEEAVGHAREGVARARESAALGLASALRQEADSQRSLADAQDQASRSIQSALRGQAQAERSLQDAQHEELRAQQDLNDARKQAVLDLEDLNSRVANGVLSERAAVIALVDAKIELGKAKPGEDQEKAQLAVDRAAQSLADLRRENARLRSEQTAASRAGVDRAQNVVAAQERVVVAVRARGDAQQGVQDAAAAADRAQVDGARQVQDAQRNVVDAHVAVVRAQTDGARQVADAQDTVRQSQQALADAQQSVADATTKTTAATSKLNDALAKLGPNQRAFFNALVDLMPVWERFRDSIGENLFAGTDVSLRQLATGLLPMLQRQLGVTATIVNGIGRGLASDLVGPLSGPLNRALGTNNVILGALAPSVHNVVSGFLGLYNAAGPLGVRLATTATHLTGLADAALREGTRNGSLEQFFNDAGTAAFRLGDIAKNTGVALFHTFREGSGSGAVLVGELDRLTGRWADWTRTVQGENAIAGWFERGRAGFAQFMGLLHDLRVNFAGIGGNLDITGSIRDMIPAVAELVRQFTGAGENGRAVGAALRDILSALARMNAGGALAAASTAFATIAGTLADLVAAIPGAGTALGLLGTALGGLALANALGLRTAFTTLAESAIPGLITRFYALSRAISATSLFSGLPLIFSDAAAAAGLLGAAVGGIGLVVGVQAWAGYRSETRAVTDSVNQLNRALSEGTVSAARAAERAVNDQLATAQRLIDKNSERGFFGSLLHPIDNAKTIAAKRGIDDLREASDRGARSLADLSGTLFQYQDTALKTTGGSQAQIRAFENGGTASKAFADLLSEAEAAGVKVGDSQDVVTRKMDEYRQAASPAAKATEALSADLRVLGDSSSTATDKADALRRVLKGLQGGTEDADTATINFNRSVGAITTSIREHGRGLDLNTTAGQNNRAAIIDAKRALDEQIASAKAANMPTAELTRLVEDGSRKLRDQIAAAGGTKQAILELQQRYGLTQPQVDTVIRALGVPQANAAVDAFDQNVQSLRDKTVTITPVLGAWSTGNGIASLDSKLQALSRADGGVTDFYARGGVRESHVAQIAPAGAMRVWAEPETGGEAYIPLAASKRGRSRAIARETVARLGGVAHFADGGIRQPVVNVTIPPVDVARMTGRVGAGLQAGVDVMSAQLAQLAGQQQSTGGPGGDQVFGEWGAPGSNIVTVSADGKSFRVNRIAATAFQNLVNDLAQNYGYHAKSIQGFTIRNIAGSRTLSNHSYGAAIDIDPNLNPVTHNGPLPFALPRNSAQIADRHSMRWGGEYGGGVTTGGYKDYMHFEIDGSPANPKRSTAAYTADSKTAAPYQPVGIAQAIGQQLAAARGWTGGLWNALRNLWQGESGWNVHADNPSSSAYGIPQALPGARMAAFGADWRDNPATQIKWGLDYIAGRYGNPMAAYTTWTGRHPHWYADGGVADGSLARPHVRDAGGPLLPGWTFNGTGRAERVQWVQPPYTPAGAGQQHARQDTVDVRVHAMTEDSIAVAVADRMQTRARDTVAVYGLAGV